MKYVIERMNEVTREWWTGSDWSDVDTDAEWSDDRHQAEGLARLIGGEVTGFEVEVE